jgi:hypothetical protein
LTKEEVSKFRAAIESDYQFLMYIDDLPIKHEIGTLKKNINGEKTYLLYTHLDIQIHFNDKNVLGGFGF